MMTLDQLIETLEEYREERGGDTEVLLATQPNWPLAFHIAQCRYVNDKLWIVEGGHPHPNPYAPRQAWDEEDPPDDLHR